MLRLFNRSVFTILACMIAFCSLGISNELKINQYVKELEQLDDKQVEYMLKSYLKGQPDDLGYSMVVLAWKESRFGKYMMNLSDGKHGSYGAFHILLDYSIVRNNVKSDWERSRLAERLVNDFDFSAEEALGLLKTWKAKYKKGKDISLYYYMFASYNGGYNALNSSQAKSYGEDALLRMAAVKRFFQKNDLIAKIERHVLYVASK